MKQSNLFTVDGMARSESVKTLLKIKDLASICRQCPELYEVRRSVVIGEGKTERPLVAFAGEAPGEQEDAEGRPFVGPGRKHLDRMLEHIALPRELVYLCNVVLCRPTVRVEGKLQNRTPTPKECVNCRPYSLGQLRAVQPHLIVALGITAARSLGVAGNTIKDIRGRWFEWEEIPVLATYHPSYLLKREIAGEFVEVEQARGDMQQVSQRIQAL